MIFYVSTRAIEDLNQYETTEILDENGNKTGAYIIIRSSGPVIRNIFGCSEIIKLDNLRLYDDGLRAWFTTHDCEQFIQFNFFRNGDHIIKWTYKECE